MSDLPKPKSNALLKTLPEDRQEIIAEWCQKPNDRDEEGNAIPKTGGLAFAREQLAADGLRVSLNTLSEFYSWWELRQMLKRADSDAQEAAEWFKSFNPLDAETARVFGEFVFTQEAIRTKSPKVFSAMANARDSRVMLELKERFDSAKLKQKDRQIAQKDKDLALVERRVQILEAKEAKAKEALGDSTLSESDKAARLKEIFGIA